MRNTKDYWCIAYLCYLIVLPIGYLFLRLCGCNLDFGFIPAKTFWLGWLLLGYVIYCETWNALNAFALAFALAPYLHIAPYLLIEVCFRVF